MSETGIYLGWRSAILGLLVVQTVILAISILTKPTNRVANRWLGWALLVIAGLLAPYAIGFAGAYDIWRGLTFAPFAISLALGPLLYAYALTLEQSSSPRNLLWHFAAPALQAAYFVFCFLLPLGPKWAWYIGGHDAVFAPLFGAMTLVSLAAYAWAIGRVLKRYRLRLASQRSDDDRFSARWLSRVRTAIIVVLVVEVGFWLWSALTGGIDYFQETGLYVCLGAIGLYLGVAGLGHARLPAALITGDIAKAPACDGVPATDWAAVAADFVGRTQEAGWWREPDLTLPQLARRLGTNTGKLSRAINIGLGVNFSVFVNKLRADAVAEALRAGSTSDLLDLAFEMGFASKASFNRAFRARYEISPSQYRRQVSNPDYSPTGANLRRAAS